MKHTIGNAILAALLAIGGAAHGAVKVAEKGQAQAVIVHNGNTKVPPPMADARDAKLIGSPADALKRYLQQITGVELPVVATLAEAGDKPAIVLELVDKVPGASDKPTGKQAYRIRTEGNRITLTAASPYGLYYAVYGLLEDHLGCRFYTYKAKGFFYGGPGYEIVPKRATLKLDQIDDLQEPAFVQRGFIFWPGSYPWIIQNRGAGQPADTISGALGVGLNMYKLLPPEDVKDKRTGQVTVKGLFAEHPELYAMDQDGKRKTDPNYPICGTNPDLPTFLAQGLERDIQARIAAARGGEVDWSMPFSARMGDGYTPCYCPACRKLVHEQQSEAAPLILALNRTLEILGRTHPQAQLITCAYFGNITAPKDLKPHPNLWVNVHCGEMSECAAGDQIGPITNNPANRDYARALREWPKLAPGRTTSWQWVPYQPEWPAIFYLGDMVKYWQECGIAAVNVHLCGNNWADLYSWVFLKLAWNPKQDADKLIRQFLEDNYGKGAAPHVWEYLKIAQAAYADSGHMPSAVRGSGWTTTTRVKMFPPSILAKMTAAMDKAIAAAEKEGDPARLANLIAARGNSVDTVILTAAAYSGKPWGPVKNPRDGKNWFVAGGDPLVPACLARAKQGILMSGGGEAGVLRTISGSAARNGGPLVELDGKTMSAAVCPDLKGQITGAVDKKSGKDLLAVQGGQVGYLDVFAKISSQIWLPVDVAEKDLRAAEDKDWTRVWSEFKNPSKDRLETDLTLSPSPYGLALDRHLRRTVSVTDAGLQIDRKYTGPLNTPNCFTTRWLLALPDSTVAKVAVKGGGLAKVLDLRYAVPGGIKGIKAGERLPGLDAMGQKFDDVIAVSDAEPVNLPITADAAGDLVIQLDRGDGLAAVLTTPAAGWEAVELKPMVDRKYLELTLVGAPAATGATAIELPVQILGAQSVAVAAAVSEKSDKSEAKIVPPKIKMTGPNAAINELDGAELVWIPAGEFLRGSPAGKGAGDERPQKKVHLDGYWIYKMPVTLAQYKAFCDTTGKKFEPTYFQGMHADPKREEGAYAAQMNWFEAEAYAKAMGAALPTEAQWEKAARGTDGREYPWGNEWDPTKCVSMEETIYKFNRGFRPVGSYPNGASPYGVLDMAGNVWEWVNDWYDYEYYQSAPDRNPTGPGKRTHKVLRGGCSLFDERFSRTAARAIMQPHVRDWVPTGFRCVVNAPGPDGK